MDARSPQLLTAGPRLLPHLLRVTTVSVVVGAVMIYIGAVARVQVLGTLVGQGVGARTASILGLVFIAVFSLASGWMVGRFSGLRGVPDALITIVTGVALYVLMVWLLTPGPLTLGKWVVGFVVVAAAYTIGALLATLSGRQPRQRIETRGEAWARTRREVSS